LWNNESLNRELLTVRRYVERNALRAGLVKRATIATGRGEVTRKDATI
jgi:hypothetical protein